MAARPTAVMVRSRLSTFSRVVASSMYRLLRPAEGADAPVPTGCPVAHLRRGKARTVASRQPDLSDADQAEYRRIHDSGGLAGLVFDVLEFDVTHGADGDFGVVATA